MTMNDILSSNGCAFLGESYLPQVTLSPKLDFRMDSASYVVLSGKVRIVGE